MPFFQGALFNEEYDCIFCVYDVDNLAQQENSPFQQIQKELFDVLGDQNAVNAVSLCTNPNILQWFLLCCDSLKKVSLQVTYKKANSHLVTHYWKDIGKERRNEKGQDATDYYAAREWQLRMMAASLSSGPYSIKNALKNGESLPLNYRLQPPGSNLLPFLKALEEGNVSFFEGIQKETHRKDDN